MNLENTNIDSITQQDSVNMIYGPGNPNDAHKIDESISLKQVFKATEYLNEALLKTYFK